MSLELAEACSLQGNECGTPGVAHSNYPFPALIPLLSCGVCSCGAMTHDTKSCVERPRKLGAKWTNKHIAADEKIESFELNYEGKRDRWNGYDATAYTRTMQAYEVWPVFFLFKGSDEQWRAEYSLAVQS